MRTTCAPLGTALLALTLVAGAAADEKDQTHHHGRPEKLGTVSFPTSCAPAVQARFVRAVALLHSFWYDEAEKAFNEVAAADPSCALLGTAPPSDKTYANQKKAGAILNRVLPLQPDHPGVAHYLIHSFDYPELAELALPAARSYSRIAESSPHALHMPSHIFVRLGLWDDSIRANEDSAAAARAHVEKTQPGAASFDEMHAVDYLTYSFLQEGRDAKAREMLERVQAVKRP